MHARRQHRLADWLPGEQIVSHYDWIERGVAGAVRRPPPPRGATLAVRLVIPLPWHDEFRNERHNTIMSRRNQCRHQHVVVIPGLAVPMLTGGALGAAHLVRTIVLGAIERDQYVVVQAVERLDPVRSLQLIKHIVEHRLELAGLDRIQFRADLTVARNFRHAEQRLAVRAPLSRRQLPLMLQKRAIIQLTNVRLGYDASHQEIPRWPTPICKPPPLPMTTPPAKRWKRLCGRMAHAAHAASRWSGSARYRASPRAPVCITAVNVSASSPRRVARFSSVPRCRCPSGGWRFT